MTVIAFIFFPQGYSKTGRDDDTHKIVEKIEHENTQEGSLREQPSISGQLIFLSMTIKYYLMALVNMLFCFQNREKIVARYIRT